MGRIGAGWTAWVLTAVSLMVAASARAADGGPDRAVAPTEQPPRRVVVSLADKKLAVIAGETVVGVFAIAVGAPATPSPVGRFTIATRVPHPTYYTPGKVVQPGPRNPLGTRWLGLSAKGYGIHGTNEPRSIGFARSHGCIRLRNRDIEALFELVRPGDAVELQAEAAPDVAHVFRDGAATTSVAAAEASAVVTAPATQTPTRMPVTR